MKSFTGFFLGAFVFTLALGSATATAQTVWYDWSDFTIAGIIEPKNNTEVPVGKTITLKCVEVVDLDTCEWKEHPPMSADSIRYTWTATSGTIVHTFGTEATWTPTTTGSAVITVAADDVPNFHDHTPGIPRTHSITLIGVSPGIVYVKAVPGGGDNGSSWANAYLNLNTAISNAPPGSEIWIATGTYKPADGSRSNTIALNKSLKLYGGFKGIASEVALYQRDWVANPTILSGDIAGDNAYSVVTITNSGVVLDGFTITLGRGVQTDGAGVFTYDCSPTIRNCTFTDNFTDGQDADGGGLDCWNASATVINCVFSGNTAGDDGGGAANKSNSNAKYINCAFYNNTTQGDDGKGDGGAVFNSASEAYPRACTVAFVNCVFANNTAQRYGGAVTLQESTSPASTATYLNCTFYGNTAGNLGDVIASRDDGNTTTLKNCIIWANNTDGATHDIYIEDLATVGITYSAVEGGYTGTGNVNLGPTNDPAFADLTAGNLVGPDNRWLTCDDGLRLMFHSPCVDAADGNAKDSYTDAGANERDALGLKHVNIRTVTDTGTATPTWYDMGAYEATVEHVIFISVDGLSGLYLQHSTLMGSTTASVMQNMKKFRDNGLWTYNARSDADYEITMPNHVTMITGRPVAQGQLTSTTTHHGYITNDTPPYNSCLHNSGNVDADSWLYKAGPFDVTKAAGMTSAMYAGKSKFILFDWSYSYRFGGDIDHTGSTTDLLDTYEWTQDPDNFYDRDSTELLGKFIISGKPKYDFNFVFFHFKGPDKYGHQDGWDTGSWDSGVQVVDQKLGTILDVVTKRDATSNIPINPAWYYNTVVIITGDHGGHDKTHGHTDTPRTHDNRDYTIPFGVWGHLIYKATGGNHDMYNWCDRTRTVPAAGSNPPHNNNYTGQPIRHADGVDLSLNLLGLDPIPDALIKGMKVKYNPWP